MKKLRIIEIKVDDAEEGSEKVFVNGELKSKGYETTTGIRSNVSVIAAYMRKYTGFGFFQTNPLTPLLGQVRIKDQIYDKDNLPEDKDGNVKKAVNDIIAFMTEV